MKPVENLFAAFFHFMCRSLFSFANNPPILFLCTSNPPFHVRVRVRGSAIISLSTSLQLSTLLDTLTNNMAHPLHTQTTHIIKISSTTPNKISNTNKKEHNLTDTINLHYRRNVIDYINLKYTHTIITQYFNI